MRSEHHMKTYLDIPYKKVEGHDLYADFYIPEDVENPPVIMWIHGGGWTELNRKWCLVFPQLERGYAVWITDMRMKQYFRRRCWI